MQLRHALLLPSRCHCCFALLKGRGEKLRAVREVAGCIWFALLASLSRSRASGLRPLLVLPAALPLPAGALQTQKFLVWVSSSMAAGRKLRWTRSPEHSDHATSACGDKHPTLPSPVANQTLLIKAIGRCTQEDVEDIYKYIYRYI